MRINRVTGEFEAQPRDDLRVRAGIRWAGRDASLSTGARNVDTDLLGAIADVRYRPWQALDLFVRYESAQIDDPYTSAGAPLNAPPLPAREITLTFVNRGSAGLRVQAGAVGAAPVQLPRRQPRERHLRRAFERVRQPCEHGARAAACPHALCGVHPPRPRGEADIDTAPTFGTLTSVQSGGEDVVTAQLAWAFGLVGQRWSTGANLTYVDGDQKLAPRLETGGGGHSFFDLDRLDGGAFLTLHHRLVEPTLEFRMIEYDERVLPRTTTGRRSSWSDSRGASTTDGRRGSRLVDVAGRLV